MTNPIPCYQQDHSFDIHKHDDGPYWYYSAPNAARLPKDITSLPKIGRLIHVRGYDKCRAAIVTGEWFITIFAPNLKPQESVLRNYRDGWHYVDECTD